MKRVPPEKSIYYCEYYISALFQVYVIIPKDGEKAFPDDETLADLWNRYIDEDCPRIEGQLNSDKKECIDLINEIRDKAHGMQT